MHISEGVLSAPVLFSGIGLAAAGTAIGLKKLDYDKISRAGVLGASFFVASLIHVPIGPSSIHLILNGIVGLLLGWAAFPVILVALILQAMIFQFGGVTILGVNTIIMATPAVITYYLFGRLIHKGRITAAIASFGCGFISVLLSSILVALSLYFTDDDFFEVASLVIVSNIPVMIIEGIITALCISFLKKVQPSMLS